MVFFSLSGYLLYRPFLERSVDLSAYAIRRLFRIFPAYLFATIGIAVLANREVKVADTLTMDHSLIAVAWTLKIEVVFYTALPLVAWIAKGRREPLMLMAAASLAFAGAADAAASRHPDRLPGLGLGRSFLACSLRISLCGGPRSSLEPTDRRRCWPGSRS